MISTGMYRLRYVTSMLLLLAGAGMAEANPVDISGSGGFHDAVIARPTSYVVTDFIAATAGTVTLTTHDMKWGDILSALSTSINTFDGQKLLLTGDATAVFDIGANQRFTASIYAWANGTKKYGLSSLDISFVSKMSQVPLPLGAWLLLSGAGLLATRTRRRQHIAALTP
jgi:hypothetical protein